MALHTFFITSTINLEKIERGIKVHIFFMYKNEKAIKGDGKNSVVVDEK